MKTKLAVLTVFVLLFLLCACGDEAPPSVDTTDAVVTDAPETEPTALDLTSFSLIRSSEADSQIVDAASAFYTALRAVEGSKGIKFSDDYLPKGTSADSSTAEILFGMTNRPESAEAIAALLGYMDFSVGMVGEKLCIAANTPERLADAAEYFLAHVSVENGVPVYTGGQYVDRYSCPLADATLCGNPVSEYTIVYPAGSSVDQAAAERLSVLLAEQTGFRLPVMEDTASSADLEILLKKTARSLLGEEEGAAVRCFSIAVSDGKVSIEAPTSIGYNAAAEALLTLMEENKVEDGLQQTTAFRGGSLDGTRVLFIGNSFTFYGGCTQIYDKVNFNDNGYFKQVATAMGDDVSVTTATYGNGVLCDETAKVNLYEIILDQYPNPWGSVMMDDFYNQDVVVLQQGSYDPEDNEAMTRKIMALFPPDTLFCFFIHHYNAYNSNVIATANTLCTEGAGVYAPTGHMIWDLVYSEEPIPGGTLICNRDSFCVNQEGDRYHPNDLNGYLSALSIYCAITGRSAVDCPHNFVRNGKQYYLPPATTNYPDILASEADMTGLKQLVDIYVKKYN
ncbi:MAG: hypothetical protein IJF49_08040 [Clostridia bacterium]|nr:hypothetical protein [Clostridia bacterium]